MAKKPFKHQIPVAYRYIVTLFVNFDEAGLDFGSFPAEWFCPCFDDREEALKLVEQYPGTNIIEVPVTSSVVN